MPPLRKMRFLSLRLGVGLAWALVFGLALLGCAREHKPLAQIDVEPQKLRLSSGAFQTLNVGLQAQLHPLRGGFPWMFVHLRDESSGEIVRTFDHQPPGWPLGERLNYPLTIFQSALAESLAEGEYALVAGIYDPKTRERFPLTGLPKSAFGWRTYELGQVIAEETQHTTWPDLEWQGNWEVEFESTEERQVLRRRWWQGRAGWTVRGPLNQAHDLWFQIFRPEIEAAGPIRVEVACTGVARPLTCSRDSLTITLPVLGESETCEIELVADHALQLEGAPGLRSAALEALAWSQTQPSVVRSGDH